MARCIGVHRPSLTCIAKKLREDGIIKYSRGRIEILNREELENSACSCYKAAAANNSFAAAASVVM
jgi:Mn-dependent DtxR family transcriptional regulator